MAKVISAEEITSVPRGRKAERWPVVEKALKGLKPGQAVLFDSEFGGTVADTKRQSVRAAIVRSWEAVGLPKASLSVLYTPDGLPQAVYRES